MYGWKSCKMSTTKVVLLACGSYNPVTNMHLRMFEIARDALNKLSRYQVVGGIMSPVSDGYKKKDLQPAKHRIAMLKAALKTSDWIKMDTWESSQSCWLQTAKVLRHFKQQMDEQYGHKPSPSKRRRKNQNTVSDLIENQLPKIETEEDQLPTVKLLCGADLLESFLVPGLWSDEDVESIVKDFGLVVITREGSDARKCIYDSDVLTKHQENIHIVTEWIPQDISSTKVRRALRRGESVKYLVQDTVLEYIQEHRLYGMPDNKYINHMMPSPNEEEASGETEDEASSSSGEISVVLRSSHGGGYHAKHVPSHRMSMTLSPKKHSGSSRVPCISDLGMLMKRVKNVRVGFTPETCV